MQFSNLEYFWLWVALVILFLALLNRTWSKNKKIKSFAEVEVLNQIVESYEKYKSKNYLYSFSIFIVSSLLFLSILGPRWGFTWKELKQSNLDLVIALDVSDSMLAEDLKPNRLERAKREIKDLLRKVRGSRVALVAFSGVAFIESPLTLDYNTFSSFLSEMDTNLIPAKGTNIKDALIESFRALGINENNREENSRKTDQNKKAIILITDGENFEGDYAEFQNLANENQITLYIIGVGTKAGSPIPIRGALKKDRSGNIIVSRLNELALAELATKTGGIFVNSVSSEQDTKTIYEKGIKLALTGNLKNAGREKRWNEQFQIPLLLALLILIFGPWGRGIDRMNNKFILILLTVLLIPKYAITENPEILGNKAKKLYEKAKYGSSLGVFRESANKFANDYRFHLGLGASNYRIGNYKEAKSNFLSSAKKTKNKVQKAHSLYNAANSLVQLTEYHEAIKVYEEALKLKPADKEIKENLEYTRKLLKQESKEQNEKNKKETKEQQKKQKQEKEKKQSEQEKKSKKKDNKEEKSNSKDQKAEQKKKEQVENQKQQEKEEEGKKEKQQKSQQRQAPKEKESPEKPAEEKLNQLGTTGAKPTPQASKKESTKSSAIDNVAEQKRVLQEYRLMKAKEKIQKYRRYNAEKDW